MLLLHLRKILWNSSFSACRNDRLDAPKCSISKENHFSFGSWKIREQLWNTQELFSRLRFICLPFFQTAIHILTECSSFFAAHGCSGDGSNSSYKVLPLYIQTQQNQHPSAGRTSGRADFVSREYRATTTIDWERSCSIINYSTEEQKPSLRTSSFWFS